MGMGNWKITATIEEGKASSDSSSKKTFADRVKLIPQIACWIVEGIGGLAIIYFLFRLFCKLFVCHPY